MVKWGADLLPRIALLVASLTVFFVIAEIVACVEWNRRVAAVEGAQRAAEEEAIAGDSELPELRGLFAVAQPNVRGMTAGVLFETNEFGFRGPARTLEKPADTFRIAVIGDSVTMGYGTRYEDLYATRIERALDQADPERRIEVINVGLSGLDITSVMNRYETVALRFDPDLVLYGYTLNDIEGDHYRRDYEGKKRDLARMRTSPLRLWRIFGPRWRSLSDLIFRPPGSYAYELDQNYFHNPEAWHDVETALDRLAAQTRTRGICTLVLLHTRLDALGFLHPYHAHYDVVAQAAAQREFVVARSFEKFRGKEATDFWVTAFDPHPNAAGHALLAEAALEALRALPTRCWDGAIR